MANITGIGNLTSKLNQAPGAPPWSTRAFIAAFNIFLSITACLGNALILVSLRKVSSIYPPTKLFFLCLAVTDLSVGIIVQPVYATLIMSPLIKINVDEVYIMSHFRDTLSWVFCGASILTSTAISVDRLLSLLLGLRYRYVITLRRVRVVIICFWFVCALLGSIRIFRNDIAIKAVSTLIPLSLITSIFCYTRIFLKLRHQQVQTGPHGQANGDIPLNIARYKKSVSNILWVQLTLVACYGPWGIAVVLYVNGIGNDVTWLVTETLIYLNSSLNPIVYCWKIRTVRQAVKQTIRQLYC